MTATRQSLTDTVLFGDPTAPTALPGDADTSVATTGFVAAAIEAENIRGLVMGKGGSVLTTDTNAADYPICVPYNCTLLRMKVTLKTAASGNMVVQLRSAAGPVTTAPSYSDVSGFVTPSGGATNGFANTRVLATVDPSNVDVSEGDFLNFSCTTGSGANILVEVVVALR